MEHVHDNGIVEYDPPIETNIFDWQIDHLDCDAIFKATDLPNATIFFYAKNKSANNALYEFQQKNHADKKIIVGLPKEEVNCVN